MLIQRLNLSCGDSERDGLESSRTRATRAEGHSQRGDEGRKNETGLTIQVPPFVNTCEKVKVDTSEARYVQRVQQFTAHRRQVSF
jgi:hypothetical protein